MQTLEVLEISIKERVFVIPFYFEGDSPIIGYTNMIYFMGNCRCLLSVNDLLYEDFGFFPR